MPLATSLSPHVRDITSDRRGRGESADTQPFALEREIEDIEAFINEAAGEAFLYRISSGAALVLETTVKLGHKVKKLALYEAPSDSDTARQLAFRNLEKAAGGGPCRRTARRRTRPLYAVREVPPEYLEGARQQQMWPLWEAVVHTLPYDAAALGEDGFVSTEKAARLLYRRSSASFPFMNTTAVALAKAFPNGKHCTLQGQTHEVEAKALAPVLVEFFNTEHCS